MRLPSRSILVGAAAIAMAATATPALAAEPVGTIQLAGGVTAVADSYIVVLKDTAVSQSMVGDTATRLVRKHGGKVARTYRAALRGFELKVDAKTAARIAADPAVAYVEQNHTVSIAATQSPTPSWGLDRIDQRNLPLNNSYTYPNTASNVTAYIIDTGIRTSHQDFAPNRATWGTNTVDSNNTDCNGHGTHVAGTVGGSSYGIAKGVKLVAVKVLNCQGSGTNAGVIAGVEWVTANAQKPAVANMSLGGGANTTLDNAVRASIASGVTYGLAAGNDNRDACSTSPARTTEGITVGSTTNTDARSSFSNYGTCLDIFAPGSSITAPWHTSDSATNTISGTSMATPHVVGAAALVASANPSWTPQQIRDYLVNNATSNVVTSPGSGSPNKLLYVVNGDTPPPANDFSVSVAPTSGSTAPGGSVTATVSTATTNGSAQSVSLAASGLPSGATASFSPSTVTSGNSSTLTISTSASTPAGTYTVTVTGTAASGSKTATFSLTVTGSSGGSCSGTNNTDVAIPDYGTASSPITISGCGRNASTASKVSVNIVHTYRGDLVIDLIAPDGSSYRLKNNNIFDSADNVVATYTVNLGSEAANGTWRLQVRDVYSGYTGYINSWSLTL